MTRAALPLPLLLIACGDIDTDTACDSCACIAHPGLIEQFPADDDTSVFYRGDIWFRHGASDAVQSIKVLDGSGTEVAGTVNNLTGNVAQFVPSEQLTPGASYTWVQYSDECEGPSHPFTVSDVGSPIADVAALAGNTWRMAPSEARPPADAPEKKALLDLTTEDLLLTITEVNGTTLSGISASATEPGGPQNMCVPTTPLTLTITEDPWGTGTIDGGWVGVSGQAIPTWGGTVSGAFSTDGVRLEGVSLRTVIDVPGALASTGEDLCDLLAPVGVNCETCEGASDGGLDCLLFAADGLIGTNVGDPVIVEVSNDDVAANPACATTTSSR